MRIKDRKPLVYESEPFPFLSIGLLILVYRKAAIVWHLKQANRTSGQFVYVPTLAHGPPVKAIEMKKEGKVLSIVGKHNEQIVFSRPLEGNKKSSFSNTAQVLRRILKNRKEILEQIGPKAATVEELKRFRDVLKVHHTSEDVFLPLFIASENDGFRTGQFSIGVLKLLDYYIDRVERTGDFRDLETTVPIIFDFYLLYHLTLLSLRIWDEGSPDENLHILRELLKELQEGEGSSGERFFTHPISLLRMATSLNNEYIEPYRDILEKISDLGKRNRIRYSILNAKDTGTHLRTLIATNYLQPPAPINEETWRAFFESEDGTTHRKGNDIDYEQLLSAFNILLSRYAELKVKAPDDPERTEIVEALLDGLTADPDFFISSPQLLRAFLPPSARPDLDKFRILLIENLDSLVEDFERFNPKRYRYSPLGQVHPVAVSIYNLMEDVLLSLISSEFEQFSYEDRLSVNQDEETDAQKREWLRLIDQRLSVFDPHFYGLPPFRNRYSHEMAH